MVEELEMEQNHNRVLNVEYFDLPRLSAYCSIGISTLRGHIKKDALPCFKLRGKILVRKSEFDAWINGFRLNKKQDLSRIVDEVVDNVKSV